MLADARAGKATLDGQPGAARRHRRAGALASRGTCVQRALALAGIPAVAAGKQSLFATAEARDLHALLLALLHAGDDGRLRAALSTVLVGVDAAGIDALEQRVPMRPTAHAHRDWQQDALGWRERLLRGGPLALVGDLCAHAAARLLGLLDGERRVSNYLQLAELLQEAQDRALGLHGLVDWLGQRIASADANDEAQLLRLESDARRVQIVTLHKSKGLEYPLVFLPFVGIGRNAAAPGRHCVAWDDDARPPPALEARPARSRMGRRQRRMETGTARRGRAPALRRPDPRRARAVARHRRFPCQRQGAAGGACWAITAALASIARHRRSTSGAPRDDLPRLPPESDAAVPPARTATRRLSHDWWVYSFSQLAQADAGDATTASTVPAAAATTNPMRRKTRPSTPTSTTRASPAPASASPCTPRWSTADFAAWRDWQPGDAAPAGQADVIADALRAEGYAADVLDDGVALTTRWSGRR